MIGKVGSYNKNKLIMYTKYQATMAAGTRRKVEYPVGRALSHGDATIKGSL